MAFIWLQKGSFQCITISFFIFFLLASILITFNYWIDSNTVIKATQSHLSYHSPIKKSLHRWDQIQSLRARRVSQSWRVFIEGTNSSFFIRVKSPTAPEDYQGRILDLPRGEELVGIILNKAQLSQCEFRNNEWICTRSNWCTVLNGNLTLDPISLSFPYGMIGPCLSDISFIRRENTSILGPEPAPYSYRATFLPKLNSKSIEVKLNAWRKGHATFLIRKLE
jgi:hypothetical protein